MKKLLLILLCFFIFTSCEKEEILPSIEMSLDGESFDPYERYAQIKTFAGKKYVQYNNGNVVKKIFILYLQVDDGEPRLDRQHFALYCLDSNANDDDKLLDIGKYTWESPDSKYAGVEIPGDQEYIVWNNVDVTNVNNDISLEAQGEFFNPYIQRTMTVDLKLENWPIGLDVNATPYGYLLD
tara:strand:- start:185 stop:730 length:546 start_codon:yes stop_codon:yes gene_type:complete